MPHYSVITINQVSGMKSLIKYLTKNINQT